MGLSVPSDGRRHKSPGLQGPIDDVLLEPFLVVTPSRTCAHPQVDRWMRFELEHFRQRWRRLFRGEVREKRDVDVTPDDLAAYHIIVWGDPTANLSVGANRRRPAAQLEFGTLNDSQPYLRGGGTCR